MQSLHAPSSLHTDLPICSPHMSPLSLFTQVLHHELSNRYRITTLELPEMTLLGKRVKLATVVASTALARLDLFANRIGIAGASDVARVGIAGQ
jgi:hypothetical protein